MVAVVLGGVVKVFGILFKFIPTLKTFITLFKAFRLAFLASPIGIILALGTALALLYDDWKTWKEGGKSLIDWSVGLRFGMVAVVLGGVVKVFGILFKFIPTLKTF
ncbi:hypothetical protein, partial [Staphylococcus aureus]|uniref:hypothetical protein n=1 Tax=Staphylococcus aureus TaxID=1280 RepID=UPI001C52AB67